MLSDDEDSGMGSGDYEDLSTIYTTSHTPAIYSTSTDVYYNTTDRSNLLLKLLSIDPSHLFSALWLLTIIASLVAIALAMTTWFVIPTWRSFKHFALINVIVSKTLLLTFSVITIIYELETGLLVFPRLSLIIWLFLSCMVFNTEKVTFHDIVDWERQYLKACSFAWGIPLTITIIIFTRPILTYIEMFSYLPVLAVNIILYFIIICTLIFKHEVGFGMVIVKATIIFCTTTLFMLVPFFYDVLFASTDLKILIIVNAIVLNLVFICMKANWWAWSEYFRMRREENINWESGYGIRYNVTATSVAIKGCETE